MNEREIIQAITQITGGADRYPSGPGDDAAVVSVDGNELAFASDALVENVHFQWDQTAPEQVGRKAAACCMSDIGAMGFRPTCLLLDVGIPAKRSVNVPGIVKGASELSETFGAHVAGGDVVRSRTCFVSVAVIGVSAGSSPVLRNGARPGDRIGVTGRLGGSILGKHLTFEPRIEEGCWLASKGIHAMIDISDGLLSDLGHVTEMSSAGAVIEEISIPVSGRAIALEEEDGTPAMSHALSDGEDFELLFTADDKTMEFIENEWPFECGLTVIGKIEDRAGIRIMQHDGSVMETGRKGFDHFHAE